VQKPDELPEDLVSGAEVGIVSQTTQTAENFGLVVNALNARGIAPEVHNTICPATSDRQKAARELASTVNKMLVIGGPNSHNTSRLYEICSKICETYHIESPDELDPAWFVGAASVGITAGASTPEDQIVAVENYLLENIPGGKLAETKSAR
jgi:4-hydroxy-3-methylbut-2-enyl diphosphate reductase